jgi:hypothetical protein
MLPICPTEVGKLCFVIGDAPQEGFVGATQFPGGTITSREGCWDQKFAEGGSNLREAQNQVNHSPHEI